MAIIPWWLFVAACCYLQAGELYNLKTGIMLSLLLFLIGLFGLWEMMIYTLAIVFISVIITVVIGIPSGVFMAKSPLGQKDTAAGA